MSNIFAAAQDSVKPVSIASGSQQREFIDQTSEQEGTWQQVPPAAAAAHKNVSESIFLQETTSPSSEKLSVNERKRKRQSHDHNQQEHLDLDQVLYMYAFPYFLQSNYFIISVPHVLVQLYTHV